MKIFDFDRNEILNKIPQIKNGICVEIGVFKGEYSEEILKNNPKILYMVDVWMPVEKGYEDSKNNKYHPNAFIDALKVSNANPSNSIMIKAESKNACELFQNESIDFLYIDANHSYDSVKRDIQLWYPKVKKGAVFGGHDYLKINWKEDKNFESNGKDKYFFAKGKGPEIISGIKDSPSFPFLKLGIFGVNPAVDEFCLEHNYELNITNDFFANWWIIKK